MDNTLLNRLPVAAREVHAQAYKNIRTNASGTASEILKSDTAYRCRKEEKILVLNSQLGKSSVFILTFTTGYVDPEIDIADESIHQLPKTPSQPLPLSKPKSQPSPLHLPPLPTPLQLTRLWPRPNLFSF